MMPKWMELYFELERTHPARRAQRIYVSADEYEELETSWNTPVDIEFPEGALHYEPKPSKPGRPGPFDRYPGMVCSVVIEVEGLLGDPEGYVCERCGWWIPRLDTEGEHCRHRVVSLPEHLTGGAIIRAKRLAGVLP